MNEEMNERSNDPGPSSLSETVVHRTYRGGRDATRAAALIDPTEVLDETTRPVSTAEGSALLAGRYEVGEILGRGATGVVHRGRDQLLGREVAIKLLYADLADDRETSARFQREAQLAARIQHANAVAVFDTGVNESQPFIVMECLSGETLATRIATNPLDNNEARNIGAQLLHALDAAHRRGVIHRDVKPGNLLMTATGSVKVADFGIATSDDRTALTTYGSVVGTLPYLAPERLRGAPATVQTDIYSAGVVLYEALTGHKPFAGDTPAELLSEITDGSPIDITTRRGDVDPALAEVVMRAIERDPAARFASAAEMARALERSRSGKRRSTLAAPPPPPSPPQRPPNDGPLVGRPSRRRLVAILTVVAAVLATVSLAFAERGAVPKSPATTTPESAGATSTVPTTVSTTRVSTTRVSTTRASTTTVRPTTTESRGNGKGKNKDDD